MESDVFSSLGVNRNMLFINSRALLWVIGILGLCLIQGCPLTPGPHPDRAKPVLIKIPDKSNSFRLVTHTYPGWDEQKNRVQRIRVYDFSDAYDGKITVYWEIKASNPVLPEGFEVTVGQVPANFYQITPPGNKIFKPNKGEIYYIAIYIGEPIWSWMATDWQAD